MSADFNMNHQPVQTTVDNKEEEEEKENIDDRRVDDDDDNTRVDGDDDSDDDDDGPPSFEKVLEYLGVPGQFQVIQVVVARSTVLVCAFMVLSFVFVGYVPYHECKGINDTQLINRYVTENNGNETYVSAHVFRGECDVRVTLISNQTVKTQERDDQTKTEVHSLSCPNGRDFFDAKDTTYASEWDLVCESKGIVEFTQTVLTIGQIIGGLIASPAADYFGRKPVVVASTCLCCLIEIAHVLSPTIYVIYAVKFFSGVLFQSAITSVYIFNVEYMVPRHRQTFSFFRSIFRVISILIIGGVASLFQDQNWRYFHGASIAAGFLAFLTPFVLKESPRWLAAKGKYEKALDVIKHMCKTNGKDFEIAKQKFNAFVSYKYSQGNKTEVPLVSPIRGGNAESDKVENSDREDSPMSETTFSPPTSSQKISDDETITTLQSSSFAMLRNTRLLILLVAVWYLWFTNILIYYGLFITSSVLAGNRFLNFILMVLVEIPSLLFALFLMNKLGRRLGFTMFIGFAGVCLMVSALMTTVGDGLPGSGTIVTVMFILGKFSITGSFTLLYVITPELFPTNVRSTAHGYCSALGRFGSMIAPYMRLFHSKVKWGPALLFTVMCCLAVIVIISLPETKHRDLPSTLDDVVNHGKRDVVNTRNGKNRKSAII